MTSSSLCGFAKNRKVSSKPLRNSEIPSRRYTRKSSANLAQRRKAQPGGMPSPKLSASAVGKRNREKANGNDIGWSTWAPGMDAGAGVLHMLLSCLPL